MMNGTNINSTSRRVNDTVQLSIGNNSYTRTTLNVLNETSQKQGPTIDESKT